MVNELTAPVVTWIGTGLLTVITFLLGLVVWFLRREIRNNDKAHAELRGDIQVTRSELRGDIRTVESDVKKLLEGDVTWVRMLLDRTDR